MIHLFYHLPHPEGVVSSLNEVEQLQGEVHFIHDDYSVFPWEGESASWEKRKQCFDECLSIALPPAEHHVRYPFERDEEIFRHIAERLSAHPDEKLCIWTSQNPPEIAMYLYAIKRLSQFKQQLYSVYMENLPFFTTDQRIFFPKRMLDIPHAELKKCVTLVHQLSEAEIEMDVEEAHAIQFLPEVRLFSGTKKMTASSFENTIDDYISQFLLLQKKPRKLEKVIHHIATHHANHLSVVIAWRVEQLVAKQTITSSPLPPNKSWMEREILWGSKTVAEHPSLASL